MAAGLGFKTFTTGEVLTSADTNGYLMQGVLVFASAAARDASITSPQEGQFAYLKDTNVTTYYTGSAWANLDTTGMTNPMTTTGDMVYSSSGSSPARLGIGSTGQVVTVAGGIPTWATPSSGGKVLQVVSATTSTTATNSTSTMATTNVTATITPTLATSTILVMCSIGGVRKGGGNAGDRGQFRLLRGATSIVPKIANYLFYTNSASVFVGALSYNYIDSPATTSATTYTVQFANGANVADFQCQYDNELSTIQLLEIGA